ncbi:pilus assembly protein TadG-related protein [Marivita sp. S2033]|uniref:pilus assembly protein TadG-related protein n=1 Tax=Marivita sp. S2033 TaxID=3373187 RepID=UPI0039819900
MSNFRADDDGAVAVIVSLLLVVLLGFTALGVDVAALYRERAQLQSRSDLTAVSAMAVPPVATERARFVLSRNNLDASALENLQTGRFLRNPAIPPSERFSALLVDDPGVNAVRVVLQDDAALHFARVFSEKTHVSLSRSALASRTGGASFSLDSHIAQIDGAALNNVLTDTFGVSAAIGIGDLNILANTSVNLGDVLDILADEIGGVGDNPAEILNATVSAGELIQSLQSALPEGVAATLTGLQSAAGSASFDVSSLIGGIDTDLGLTATDFLAGVEISALDVIKALVSAQTAGGALELDASISAPNLLSLRTSVTAGEPAARSGWIGLGEEGAELHRAAVRLQTELAIAPNLLGHLGIGLDVASVNLPIYTEIAGSTATLESITCDASDPENPAASFSTSATPLHPANGTSVAALYLGSLPDHAGPVDPSELQFADLLTLDIVVATGLLLPDIRIPGVIIQVRSRVTVGSSQTETIRFTHEDVQIGRTTKTFGSGEVLTSAVNGLFSKDNTELRVKPGQGGLVSGLAAPIVAGVLRTLPDLLVSRLAAPVDSVLDATLQTIGLNLGVGELTLTGHHCEPIRLVR